MPLRQAETWIFDLDNTLYPASCNLFAQVDRHIGEFIAGLLKIDADEAYRIQKQYFRDYGTSLRGLMIHHDVDPQLFLDFVHAIDVTPVQPSPALERTLGMITEILAYIVSWLLYPLAAYEICRLIGRESEYPGYIVVYNWSTIILVGVEVLVWLPTFAGATAAETSQRLDFLVSHIYLIYLWFIARGALRIHPLSAVGMVFTDYILTSVLAGIHDALLKPAVS